jgi:hypothetical protein
MCVQYFSFDFGWPKEVGSYNLKFVLASDELIIISHKSKNKLPHQKLFRPFLLHNGILVPNSFTFNRWTCQLPGAHTDYLIFCNFSFRESLEKGSKLLNVLMNY